VSETEPAVLVEPLNKVYRVPTEQVHTFKGGALHPFRRTTYIVSDQRLQPTHIADLAEAVIDAVGRGAEGIVRLPAEGACSWFKLTKAIMKIAGIDVDLEAVSTTIPPGGVDRSINGVLGRPRAYALGLPRLRPWREKLADYVSEVALAV
jgi:dTDP-4-dehydrorhamnose reductase